MNVTGQDQTFPAAPAPFILTPEEFRHYANRMGARQIARLRQGQGARATIVLIAVLAVLCLGLWSGGLVARRTALLIFILTLFAALVARLITYAMFASAQARAAADAAADPALFKSERRITVTVDGLSINTGRETRTIPFATLRQVETGDGLLFIWTGTADAVVIPLRAFPDAEAGSTFAGWIQDRTPRRP